MKVGQEGTGDYPPFEEAVSRLVNFLASQGYPKTISWVRPEDVAWVRKKLFVRCQADQAERQAEARHAYHVATGRRLGVQFAMLCSLGETTCCYVWSPHDEDEAERSLMPNGLKLKVPLKPLPARHVKLALEWGWRKWRGRRWEEQKACLFT